MKFTDLERITAVSTGYSRLTVFHSSNILGAFHFVILLNLKNILWGRCYYHHYSYFTSEETRDLRQIASKYYNQDSRPSCPAPGLLSFEIFITMSFA